MIAFENPSMPDDLLFLITFKKLRNFFPVMMSLQTRECLSVA